MLDVVIVLVCAGLFLFCLGKAGYHFLKGALHQRFEDGKKFQRQEDENLRKLVPIWSCEQAWQSHGLIVDKYAKQAAEFSNCNPCLKSDKLYQDVILFKIDRESKFGNFYCEFNRNFIINQDANPKRIRFLLDMDGFGVQEFEDKFVIMWNVKRT